MSLGELVAPGDDAAVKGAGVTEDACEETADVAFVGEEGRCKAGVVAVDLGRLEEGIVQAAAGDAEPGDLVPVADVKEGVGEVVVPCFWVLL